MLSMKRNLILIAFLMVLSLGMLSGCNQQQPASGSTGSTPGYLTIKGDGVGHPTRFKVTELKGMEEALVSECYSAVNNWPTKKYFMGEGVRISYLLQKTAIKNNAQTIIVRGGDGYSATFTRRQLEEKRFCFPHLLEDSTEGAREVPAILAWKHGEGNDLTKAAADGKLHLFLGQKGLNDAVVPVCVKGVTIIEVMTSPPGQWVAVQAEPAPGKLKRGTNITLNHPEQDQVKIYYTIDGSIPDEESLLYNPTTTCFQPDLIKPITIEQPMLIKAVVMGFGKNNSPVVTFAYEVE